MENEQRSEQGSESDNFAVRGLSPEAIARIEAEIKKRGSKREFAQSADIPLSTLNEALGGKREPRWSTMIAIADALGKSVEWLRTGLDGGSQAREPEYFAVPVLPEAVSAGGGTVADENDNGATAHIMMGYGFLKSLSVKPQNAAVLTVRGDSMEPTLAGGDLILVDTSDTSLATGGVFVIAFNGGVMVKRITRRVDGAIMVISDNQALYPPETITESNAETFRVIGRVRWHARALR